MAGVIRVGIIRILGRQNSLLNTQKCNISGKSMRGTDRPPKPKPWPYETKKYGIIQALYEKTSKRLDENSKIICVEGPIAIGKTKFAKELATELEMHHMPEATMDLMFINPYGYDMRKLDPQLPESCKSFDEARFCKEPNHTLTAQFQIRKYMLRYSQYVDALAHLLNTGQGVVLERSPFSDFIFLETMHKHGYISKLARNAYYDIRNNTIQELLKPHLVIYLDGSPKVVMDRIKARNHDGEVNSKVFTEEYISDMESLYKQQYLKSISEHAEILVYDWSEVGETEVIVEDIERIDFNQFEIDRHNKKMKDWRKPLEWDWCEARMKYSNEKEELMNYFNVPQFEVPELLRGPEDGQKWREVWFNAPGMKYALGYNADMGDTGILTKTKLELRNNK